MNTTKTESEIIELCANDVDAVSGGNVGYVALAVGMAFVISKYIEHVQQQAM